MRVVCDIECSALENPTQIWVIVCKDIDNGTLHIFREPSCGSRQSSEGDAEKTRFLEFSKEVTLWIGHNWLGYDYPILHNLVDLCVVDIAANSLDTLIVSRLVDFSSSVHSIEAYGEEFGYPKGKFSDWSKYTQEMEAYCVRDVEICERVYRKHQRYVNDTKRKPSILAEQRFQLIVNDIHNNGFCFNSQKADRLLSKVNEALANFDTEIAEAFPPRLSLIREITPELTKHGTLHKKDFRWVEGGDLSEFNGGPFSRCEWRPFNPASHKQLIDVLSAAGWRPTDKTKTHIESLRNREERPDLVKYGWKINETNLSTLPERAPKPARILAKRILYESRRRTLTEWLGLVTPQERIQGQFFGIGAWTHRMSHQKPNTANIPNELDTQGKIKLLGGEMRSLWCAPKNRLLIGVDAEGIQLRIFAHYINDKEFTEALVNGRKEDKSDPHSLNQRIMGSVCRSRAAAKRFIYALLLGAGTGKLAEVLECSRDEAEAAVDKLRKRYAGFDFLKREVIPHDAKRGWFEGLDERKVVIPGDTPNERRHLAMSGYLQNGEAVVMKHATIKWYPRVLKVDPTYLLVDLVHDEWQGESINDLTKAIKIAKIKADSLREVGEELNLRCPLAGSYKTDGEYTIGTNWRVTH
jgi:DNA polymerase-1